VWVTTGEATDLLVTGLLRLGQPPLGLAMVETLRGSGAFCHWDACLAWNAASGKRLPTPAGRGVACRLVSPDAFLATQVESG
jgi:hypothetical protein